MNANQSHYSFEFIHRLLDQFSIKAVSPYQSKEPHFLKLS